MKPRPNRRYTAFKILCVSALLMTSARTSVGDVLSRWLGADEIKLTAADASAGDSVSSVSISGDTALLGSVHRDDVGAANALLSYTWACVPLPETHFDIRVAQDAVVALATL